MYSAARDGLFFRPLGRPHPRSQFPRVSLLVMGIITAIGSFFSLAPVINVPLAVFVIPQALAQAVPLCCAGVSPTYCGCTVSGCIYCVA